VILQPELLLSKVNEDENIFSCPALFVQLGLQPISDTLMRIYSVDSIAENRLLPAGLSF